MLTDCRLTIAGQIDASSVASLVDGVIAALPADASIEDKVLALYRYVREHLFAFVSTMDDMLEPLNKAMQTLNWWGFGLCGRQAKTLGVLAAHLLGAENARLVGMTEASVGAWRIGQAGRPYAFVWTPRTRGWQPGGLGGHTSLEIRWDGRWHFLDAMVGFYRRDRGGAIASLQQIIDDPILADQPTGDPLHGDMPYGPEPEIFTRSTVRFHDPGLNTWPGELPPLNLRQGERLTFLPEPIPGEFFIHPKMRAMFNDDVSANGPREARPNAPAAKYGNGEHVCEVDLRPCCNDPFWRPETGDFHVTVRVPYPITSIHWQMSPLAGEQSCSAGRQASGGGAGNCSGFLFYPPSTGDQIMPIPAAGSHRAGPQATVGLEYRIITRPPGPACSLRLRLRTIVQHNPLVRPVLKNGLNVVRLAAGGDGLLAAQIDYTLAGKPQTVRLHDAGRHEVVVGDGHIADQSVTLMNCG